MANERVVLELVATPGNAITTLAEARAALASLGVEAEATSIKIRETGAAATAAGAESATAFETARAAGGGLLGIVQQIHPALLAIAGVAGISFGLDRVITDFQKWNQEVLSVTTAMNGNAVAGSELLAVFGRFDITGAQLIARFDQLARRMDTNPDAFKRFGIDVYDAAGNLKSMDVIIPELMDKMASLGNTTQGVAAANEMFGRSMGNFAQVFTVVANNWQVLSEEAKKYGLVIDNNVLESNLNMTQGLRSVQQEFKGLFIMLGQQLMPIVLEVGQAIGGWLVQNFDAIRNAIQQAVAWLGAFFTTLTGLTGTVDPAARAIAQFAGSFGTLNDQMDTGVDPKVKNASANKALTESTADATQAIQDQIKVLADQKKATDELYDSQIASLEAQKTLLAQTDQLIQLNENLASQNEQIAKDQTALAQDTFSGNFAKATADQEKLNDDKVKAGDIQRSITRDTVTFNIDQQIKQLQAEKKARDDDFADQTTALNNQMAKIRQAAQDQIAASAAVGAAGVDSANGIGTAFTNMFNTQMQQGDGSESRLRGNFSGASAAGIKAANDLKASFQGLADMLGFIAGMIGVVGAAFKTLSATVGPTVQFGQGGAQNPLPSGDLNPIDHMIQVIGNDLDAINKVLQAPMALFGRAGGGSVLPGMDYIVGESGPEVLRMGSDGGWVYPTGTSPSSGGNNIQIGPFYGTQNADEVVSVVHAELGNLLGQLA